MHVDAAELWNVQHALRQDLSIGDHDDQVRRQRAKLFHSSIVAEALRLHDGQADGKRVLLHRRLRQLHAAILRRIRLRIDGRDLKAAFMEPLQAHAGNVRRAHINESHSASSASLSCFMISSSSSGESIRSAISVYICPSRWSIS